MLGPGRCGFKAVPGTPRAVPGYSRAMIPARLRPFAFVLALAVAATGCAAPRAAVAPAVGAAPQRMLPGVPRFAVVEPGFARGGLPDDDGIRALAAAGFRTVLSLRRDDEERARVLAAGMDYVEVSMSAGLFGAPAPDSAQVAAFLAVVGDSARRPVFVHCRRGRDRTGVMVALWRVRHGGWSPEEAVAEMEDRGMSAHYRAYRRFIRALRSAPG